MTRVFVDSVGLLALWNSTDQWHAAAEKAWQNVLAVSATPYTTPFILAECGNSAARRSFRPSATSIRKQFEQAQTLIWPGDAEWEEAWNACENQGPGSPGIVDQISFVVMRRLSITDAFTNDRHFTAAGFNTLF
ncbi:MAG TPA: PIN domain-containing protein [Tepidisphaeraceae bacterium]|jgi:predicted nucleic acid-binding protein|nr:PIN domain-containing protein [Tepidisphaeraceae bacterium]